MPARSDWSFSLEMSPNAPGGVSRAKLSALWGTSPSAGGAGSVSVSGFELASKGSPSGPSSFWPSFNCPVGTAPPESCGAATMPNVRRSFSSRKLDGITAPPPTMSLYASTAARTNSAASSGTMALP